MKVVLVIWMSLLLVQGYGQQYGDPEHFLIDSLDLNKLSEFDQSLLDNSLNQFHNATTDTGKIGALGQICQQMMSVRWVDYQHYQYKLITKALKKDHTPNAQDFLQSKLAGAYNNLGYASKMKGEFTKAEKYYNKSLKMFKKQGNLNGISDCHNNIGAVYYQRGDLEKALEHYHKAVEISEKEGNHAELAPTYNNIAYVHQLMGNDTTALQYYFKSLEMYKALGSKRGEGLCFNNIGVFYSRNGELEKAKEYYLLGLEIAKEMGDLSAVAGSYNNLGQLADRNGNSEEALDYYLKGLTNFEEVEDMNGVSVSCNNVGGLLYSMNRFKEAKKYLERSYDLAIRSESAKWMSESAGWLSKLSVHEGNYKRALEYFKIEIEMRDSVANENNQKAAAKQQAKYEYEKQKALDDAEHEKQLAIEQEAKEKQQIITYATAGGLGLVGVFLLFVFNRLKVTRKQKNIIENAHHELEEKNQEILDSISYAKRIQSAILPPNKVVKEYLKESFILYKPKDIVAGDFYWLEHVGGKVLFAAADCTGHGVPGAMVSVVCNNGLNRSVREHGLTEPGKILDKTREIVIQEFEKSEDEVKDGMDIALCSLEGNKLSYAGANNPLWIIRKGEIIETKANKQPIGKFDHPEPYTTHSFDLEPGDSLYIFSDGYVDQFGGEKGKKFKARAFRELLLSIQEKAMEEQKQIIDDAFEAWKGDLEQIDDVCVIGVRV